MATVPAAGPELDRLVHERVMGYHVRTLPPIPAFDRNAPLDLRPGTVHLMEGMPARLEEVPAYSADIERAWTVVESLRARENRWVDVRAGGLGYSVRIGRIGNETVGVVYANADDAPLAICRAALLAVGA